MKKDLLKGLSEEQIAKVKACNNSDELLSLAKAEGVELTDEQLTAISGGGVCSDINPFDCPKCGSGNLEKDGREYTCKKCGYTWIQIS